MYPPWTYIDRPLSNCCLEGVEGFILVFPRKHIAICDFPRGPDTLPLLDPSVLDMVNACAKQCMVQVKLCRCISSLNEHSLLK